MCYLENSFPMEECKQRDQEAVKDGYCSSPGKSDGDTDQNTGNGDKRAGWVWSGTDIEHTVCVICAVAE
jgi:hypothetical protein